MNLFNVELKAENQVKVMQNSDLKYFKRHLGLIVDAYLCRKISFLTYIEKIYEIHRKFNRKGFSKQDLNEGKKRFLKHQIPMRNS